MAKKLTMNLSFPQYDKHIYDFVKSQPNPSAFIRKLVEAYMNGNMTMGMQQPMNNPFLMNNQAMMQNYQAMMMMMNNQAMMQNNLEEEQKLEEEEEVIEAGEFTPEFDSNVDFSKINDLPI